MTKIKKKYAKLFTILICCLSFIVCIALADLFSSFITIKTFNNQTNSLATKIASYNIYAISLYNSEAKSSALEKANQIKKQNGAGFIWQQNNNYYVLASAYLEQNDANLVKQNLEKNLLSASIITLTFNEICFSNSYSANELTALMDCVGVYKTCYQTLYDISVSLDTKVYGITESKLEISNIQTKVSAVKSNFDAIFSSKLTTNLLFLKISNNAVYEKVENLINFEESSSQTFSSKLKQTYLEILSLNQELCQSISNI